MKYITSFLLMLLLSTAAAVAQDRKIKGLLIDGDTQETMYQTTVALLRMDSTLVTGTLSNDSGRFVLQAPADGRYLVRISSVGYETQYKRIVISDGRDLDFGRLVLKSDAVMLKEAKVMGKALKVTLKEDTFVYNSAAYRTPEGSVVEELIKRLPGAKVDDDGTITINGKTVKKVMIDGKEFMTGDTKTAMKNLPTSIIEKIKVYDEKSDLSRVTGIDDGEEQTVLDFGVKRGMNKGIFSNIDLSIGTHNRFAERLMGAYFKDDVRVMTFGNFNNTSDRGFPGGGGRGQFGGGNGLNTSKMWGSNFNYEKKGVLKMNGSVRWNHRNGNVLSKNSSENFVSQRGSFSNSQNQSFSRSNNWNFQARLEWTPDTMTNIMFRPSMSLSSSDSRSWSNSATYNEDPYNYVDDPLDGAAIAQLAADSLMMNSRQNRSIGYNEEKRAGVMLQYNRKLGNNGRNVTARADFSYSDGDSKNLSTSNVHLYQLADLTGNDSTYQTNRYNLTPTRNWNYSLQATYSEPLWRATFLQFNYRFNYSYSKSDRSTFDFSNLGEDFFAGLTPIYRDWDSYLGRLASPYTEYLDTDLSRFSEYKTMTHDMELMFRMIREKYNFNVGIMVQPQRTKFIQDYQGIHTDTVRTVTNITPTLDFRYRFSKVSNLRLNYRGSTSQPSMTQLLDITDDSDPLNISKGNPGLKPAFTNTFRAFYNNYITNHQRAIMANLQFSTTRNSISNMVTYDEQTGGRTIRPENINGYWSGRGTFMFNTSIDTAGVWNVNTTTDFNYTNNVGYVSLDQQSSSVKNTTKDFTLGERLAGSFRNDWLEVELDGSLSYRHARNQLQATANLDTWNFAYGVSVNATTPWGMSISTDIHENSRRGYADRSMNTNELIWNAQIAQGFLKGRPLTVSLQFYDILKQQSNFSRSLNAYQRSDTWYNSINSYAMLHVIYRLNIFGGRDARQEMRHGPGPGPGRDRPRGGFGNPGRRGGGGFGGPMMMD